MPRMSLPKHAMAMCDTRPAGLQDVCGVSPMRRQGAYEDVVRRINDEETDEQIAEAHPDWADILPAVRSSLRKKKKP